MRSKKILVIGYFGYTNNQLDGQTIRTRSIYGLLKKHLTNDIMIFDTQSVKESKLNLLKLIYLIYQTDTIFNIAAHRNLKYFFPLAFIVSKMSKSELNYIAVGGWLNSYLEKLPVHKFLLSRVNNLFVQTNNLSESLRDSGLNNVEVLNNFRLVELPKVEISNTQKTINSMVFFARVHPLKGVDTIFKLSKELESLGPDYNKIKIDIYGPILEEYKAEFFRSIDKTSVNYCGILQPDEIHNVLKDYDLMLFPTKFYTEGFPGSILDAYISGTPVIATNWLNAQEFIKHGETGYITQFDDEREFINRVIDTVKDPKDINSMRKKILLVRENYSAQNAWSVLKKAL